MHLRLPLGLLSAAAALSLLAAPVGIRAQDTKPAAPAAKSGLLAGLPKDTLFLVHVPRAGVLVEKGKRSPFYKLKDHAEVKGLIAKFAGEVEKGAAEAQQKIGVNPLELLGSFQGEVALAFGSLDQLATELGQALAMARDPSPRLDTLPLLIAGDAGDASAKVKEQLSKLYAFFEKEGAQKTTTDFKGGKVMVFKKGNAPGAAKGGGDAKSGEAGDSKSGDGGPKAAGEEMTICVGELGNHVFLSPSRQFLERCMTGVASPGQESLADNPLYGATLSALRAGGDAVVYVDVKQLTNAVGRALSSSFFGFYWQKVESLIFGKSLNTFATSLHLEDTGLRQSIFVHNGGAADGLLGLLKTDAFPSTPPAFIPEKAHTFASIGFSPASLERLVREVSEVAMQFQAGAGSDVDAFFEQTYGVKLKDLFASLGKRLHIFAQDVPGGAALQGVDVAIELKDEAVVKQLLQKSAQGEGGMVSVVKHKERDIFSLGPDAGGAAVTLVEKTILGSQSVERIQAMMDRMTGGAGKPAPVLAEYANLSKAVPPSVVALYFVSEAAMKSQVRSAADQIPVDSEEESKAIRAALNALSDVLGPSVTFGAWKDTGLYSEEIYLYSGK